MFNKFNLLKYEKMNDKIQIKIAKIIADYKINPSDNKNIEQMKKVSNYIINYLPSLKNKSSYNTTTGQLSFLIKKLMPYLTKYIEDIINLIL